MNFFINNGYSLYRTPKLEMPEIEAYIIYSGRSIPRIFSSGFLQTDEEGRYVLSMNKEFFGGKAGQPEFLAKVIYVKNGTGILEEYIRFSQIFDEQMAKYKHEPAKAAGEIFRICEEEKVLTAYLAEHRAEVEKIMLTMVSPEYIERSERKVDAIRSAIESLRMFGHSDDEIKEHLVKRFGITPGYAQNCLDADWEDEDD